MMESFLIIHRAARSTNNDFGGELHRRRRERRKVGRMIEGSNPPPPPPPLPGEEPLNMPWNHPIKRVNHLDGGCADLPHYQGTHGVWASHRTLQTAASLHQRKRSRFETSPPLKFPHKKHQCCPACTCWGYGSAASEASRRGWTRDRATKDTAGGLLGRFQTQFTDKDVGQRN